MLLSCVLVVATPQTVALQAPLSLGFLKQEYWSGLPFTSPGDLPDPEMEPRSPTLQADALTSEPPGKPRREENKRKKEFNLEAWEKENPSTVSFLQT